MLEPLRRWLLERHDAGNLLARGREAEARGALGEACGHYRAAVAAAPGSAAAHLHLGVALEGCGDLDGAVASYQAALAAEAGNPFAHYNLGKARYLRGESERAEVHLRSALAVRPDFPEAEIVLADLLESRGDATSAAAMVAATVARHPSQGAAWRQLGMLYCRQERWDEAAAALGQAKAADSGDAVSRSWLGNLLADQGRRDEAAQNLAEALALDPALAHAHIGLGNLHAAGRAYDEAASCYRRAAELDPRNVQAQVNLANALAYLGQSAEARDRCEAALALDPGNAVARWIRVMAGVPAVRTAPGDLGELRHRFGEELRALDRWFDPSRSPGGHRAVGVQQPFWLAYQDADNLGLLQTYGRLCARLMQQWQRAGDLAPRLPGPAGPIRVAIVSQYFRRHAVWDALMRGWFEALDPNRFELHAFHLGLARDAETAFAQRRAARFEHGPRPLRQWAESILESRPHVLVYPEVGMDPMALKLAALRLAPVQAASWGHPETTGLPTIDCFLSAQALEPDGAQAHYAEKLVALPGLGCFVQPHPGPEAPADPAAWNLPPEVPILLCPGTPYKYAPEHDSVLTAIACALGECRLVFFTSAHAALSEKLRRRLAGTFAREGLEPDRYLHFLPWLPQPEFHGLMRRADAMLDTIGFSGINTALQAIGCGLPVVAYEGRFLRSRLASGLLRHMGMGELVAADAAAYVALAVRLAHDAAYREDVRRRLEHGRDVLYRDPAPMRALERFLEDAAAGYSSDSR